MAKILEKEHHTFKTTEDPSKKNFYALDMFPYPSGQGLQCRHPEGYTATDAISRMETCTRIQCTSPNGMGCIWTSCRTIRS